ncbi:MAG: S8 family serine peptidase, partial [Actinomycetia bacterium]|nr:S8 family serine peptidase [Actinomycetes bacterium]
GPLCIDNWGLDRIGEESLPSDYRYQWPSHAVSQRIYVFDTGVRDSHREFAGFSGSRVTQLINATTEPDGDFYGHGTHVAAIAAGRTYGVAKRASIYDVKILASTSTPPSTYLSWMLAGLQAIQSHMTSDPPTGTAVLNWSGANFDVFVTSTGKQYVLLRQELVGMLEDHEDLLLVQSAGNDGQDACDLSFG